MTNPPGDGPTPGPNEPQPNQPQPDQPGAQPDQPGAQPTQPQPGAQPGYWEQQQQPPYPPPGYPAGAPVQYAPDHPRATTSLVLGILGIVLCQLVAPFAWSMGKKTLDEIDASQGQVGGRGAAQAGYILGIVGTVLLGLGIIFIIIWVVLMGVLTGLSTTNG